MLPRCVTRGVFPGGCRYKRLRDADLTVRKNTLMVLSHLILNDMLKAKAPVIDIARCLDPEEDSRISDLAKLFFHELAKKAGDKNPIYNILPDIISRLYRARDVRTPPAALLR